MSRVTSGCVVGIGFLSAIALAGDGDLLWHTEVPGNPGLYRGVWTATTTRKLVVVGGSDYSASRTGAFSVWAFDQKRGELQWENHLRPEVGDESWVEGVAAKGNVVVAAGSTEGVEGGRAFSVVAFAARSGQVLWEDHLDAEDTKQDNANAVAIGGRTAVAVGTSITELGGWSFFVRAYDVRSGELVWEDRYEREANRPDSASGVAVLGKRAFVVGRTSTSATNDSATIRAYDLRDGALLWQDHVDHLGDASDGFDRVTTANGRVFVTGFSGNQLADLVMVTRAYRAADGALLWEDAYSAGHAGPRFIAADRSLVAIATRSVDVSTSAFAVRALDARTGSFVWDYRLPRPLDATGSDRDAARFVALGKKAVYAAGIHGSPNFDHAFAVVALSRKDGAELWRDVYDEENSETAWCGATTKSRLFVSGDVETPAGDWFLPVRAYKAK